MATVPPRQTRRYDSPVRRERSAETRERIVEAGSALVHELGQVRRNEVPPFRTGEPTTSKPATTTRSRRNEVPPFRAGEPLYYVDGDTPKLSPQ